MEGGKNWSVQFYLEKKKEKNTAHLSLSLRGSLK